MSMLGHYASYPIMREGELIECPCHGSEGHIGLFDRHNCSPIGAIHVGAWDCAEKGCYSPLFGDNVIYIEANPYTYNNLTLPSIHNAPNSFQSDFKYGNPNWKSYNCTIFNEDDVLVNLSNQGDTSHIKLNNINLSEGLQVKTKKLDTLISEENIDMNNYNFLNIDIEGGELKALQGFENNINYINYIMAEVSTEKKQEYACTLDEITKYLKTKGFELAEISDSINTLKWGDAFFIKK